ncbi:MAG: hypothetical protein A4E63_01855 [Syntrophorhabdus sp. PtaU1.Bin050]|nr:MAG: hypothetical protein A4E63_01855 [Syntrophorhabdus sp. PtaU1.Bin050]
MAGAFTHFIICDVAKKRRSAIGVELWQLLNKHSQFLFLGAASPDLPYLSFKTGKINWADKMHYEKTNGIVINGYLDLKKVWANKTPAEEIKLVWLLGYASHLVADATIHPIVQAIVGPYEENKDEHRICEMTQDSLIFNEYKNNDISYGEFSSILKLCDESKYFEGLMDFWKNLVVRTYDDAEEEPRPSLWFETYTTAIDLAEGGSDIVALFRHIGIGEGFSYKTKEEILSQYPEYHSNYYQKVKLPNKGTGSFKQDGFERAANNVLNAWNSLYAGLSSEVSIANTLKNWNLDTGVDMDSPSKEITYWL